MTERKQSQSKMVYLFAAIGLLGIIVGIVVMGHVQAYLQVDVIKTTTSSPKW